MLTRNRISSLIGIDFHILFLLVMRLWSVLAGGVMIFGIPFWFSGAEQGFYFTFSSLIALQIFFELGLNFVITQFVGHEVAHLRREGGTWTGPDDHRDRLASLIARLKGWYHLIAMAFFLLVSAGGYIFFSMSTAAGVTDWQIGWFGLVFFSACNLYLSPFLAVAEGAGMVGEVARLRLVQSVIGYLLLWAALSGGAGLRALPILALVNAAGTWWWLRNDGRPIHELGQSKISNPAHAISWRRDIFPFQWRISLSWISGYLIFQLFNPILFTYQGPVEAGRIGLGLVAFSTLLTVAMSWVNAKTPVMAGMLARNERAQAASLFFNVTLRSACLNLLGCGAILLMVWGLRRSDFTIGDRFPDMPALFFLAIATIANQFVFAAAAYLRAHKQEPMLATSVVVAILSLFAVAIGARHSALMTMALYAGITVFVALPWTAIILRRYLRPTEQG